MTLPEHDLRGSGTAYRMHPLRLHRVPAGTDRLSDGASARLAGDSLVRHGVRTRPSRLVRSTHR